MEKEVKIKENFNLEMPKEEITETGFYNVKRTVRGVEDIIEILFWSDKDMTRAEKNAEKRKGNIKFEAKNAKVTS